MQRSVPTLDDLATALSELGPWLGRSRTAARAGTNVEGGDPASHASPTLLARHLGHYLAAAEVVGSAARLVDVGCGTGAFTGWLGERIGASVTVVDHDPAVLAVAAEVARADATARDLHDVPPAPLVTAMEVLEHIEPDAQASFCRALVRTVADHGVLVLSTPDESLYPGGWSGYAPHVGCVTAGQLATLLLDAGARTVDVHRLVGGPYETPPLRRWGEAVGNRVWTRVRALAPATADRLATGDDSASVDLEVDPAAVALEQVSVLPAEEGEGGSLVAVVRV